MSEPLVSIIIRTIDRPVMLREAISSLAIQEHKNLEIIVVNDGGPKVQEKLNRYFPSLNIKLIENENPAGRSNAANLGLDLSTGEYICFLDDDDIFYPFHVSELLQALKVSKKSVVYSDGICAEQIVCPFDTARYMTVGMRVKKSSDFTREKILEDNFIPFCCVMFEKKVLKNIRFDEMLDVLEDWDFWINLSKENDFEHLKQVTCEYRWRNDGTNTTGQFEYIWWWSRKYLKDKHPDLVYESKRA